MSHIFLSFSENHHNFEEKYIDKDQYEYWLVNRRYLFEKYLAVINSMKDGGTILDIGCGQGYFLDLARETGWKVTGVDLSEKACEFIREEYGIEAIQGQLQTIDFSPGAFDVVTLWDVLYYVRDPFEELKTIYTILKDDGMLVLRLPTNRTWMIKLYTFVFDRRNKNKFPPFVNKDWLYIFPVKTLVSMLKKAGFREVNVVNNELTQWSILKLHQKIFRKLVSYLIQGFYYLSFKKLILGLSINVYARK